MADVAFNVAKGREAYYASLPGSNDALIVVPIEATGVEADGTIVDHDTLAAVLGGSSNEQTTMARQTLSGVSVTVDDTGNKVTLDANDVVFTGATGNDTAKLLLCYDPDTTSGTDSDIVPIVAWDFVTDPAGGDITAAINAAGIMDLT